MHIDEIWLIIYVILTHLIKTWFVVLFCTVEQFLMPLLIVFSPSFRAAAMSGLLLSINRMIENQSPNILIINLPF